MTVRLPAPTGFVLAHHGDQVELSVTGERPERLVSHARSGPHLLVLMGRLFYRDELLRRVVTPVTEQPRTSEDDTTAASLALAVYLSEGRRGLARLEGEFCLVLWDGRDRQIIARRDPVGTYPLFWTRSRGITRFATGMRPLVATLADRAVNLDFVADYLAAGWLAERPEEACAYSGVKRILSDTMVSVDPATGGVQRHAYWDWQDHIEDPGTSRVADAAPRFRELLSAAVGERVSGVCGAQLSGGMDSTSVCLLALQQMRAGTGELPLHALSLVYHRLPQLSRERRYVESILQAEAPDLAGIRLVADDLLHYDGFEDPPFHDEPFARAPALHTEAVLMAAAATAGVTTVLTGDGADDFLVVSSRRIVDLARQGRLGAAWREASRTAAALNTGGGEIFRRQVISPASTGVRRRLASVLPSVPGASNGRGPATIPGWITGDFARRYRLADRFAEDRRRKRQASTRVWSDALYQLDARRADGFQMAIAAPYGISLSHPFLDPRVIGFALGALDRLTPEPSPQKPLLAAAMAGLLPDEIRLRPAKRSFNEVYYLGVGRHRAELEALIDAGDEYGIIEPAPLLATLDEATMAVAGPSTFIPMGITLSLLRWLSLQDQWQSACPPQQVLVRLDLLTGDTTAGKG